MKVYISKFWLCLFCVSISISLLHVSADLQKGLMPSNKSLESYIDEEVDILDDFYNSSHVPDPIEENVNVITEEIRGSFDELTTATLNLNAESQEELLQPTGGLKYTTITEGLSESGEGVMVTLMEQGMVAEPPVQNTSSLVAAVQDKGGGTGPSDSQPESNMTEQPHDDIPSFSEWAKKQLAEAEKNKGENLTLGNNNASTMKVRSKNYASPDCGAKVLGANPEALSPGAVLSSSRDEYILSPCNARIWFIVELCEAIQPQRIEVGNFELFSSSPKEFSVHLSDRYPTREWTHAATLTAKDERTVQMFSLPHLPQFAKFIKVELHSHYGTEHYCPVSLFRAYGTSELEVLETVDEVALLGNEEEDEGVGGGEENGDLTRPQNLFGSARDAVLSIVKKAAEVLVVKSQSNTTCKEANSSASQAGLCVTPGYLLVCHNCSDQFFYRVYHLLCCHQASLQPLLSSTFVTRVLSQSSLCSSIGLDWPKRIAPLPVRPRTTVNPYCPPASYLQALLPKETIADYCNYLAVSHRKVVLNVSHEGRLFQQEKASVSEERKNSSSELPLPPSEVTPVTTEMETAASSLSSPPEVQVTTDPATVISPTRTLTKESEHFSEELNATTTSQHSISNETQTLTTETDSSSSVIDQVLPTIISGNPVDEGVKENKTEIDNGSVVEIGGEEGGGVDALALDTLLSELEEESEATVITRATTSPPHPVQKESVFVRLANRIKALERNMSLSGQYLEELSRRYKRQVEELQRSLAAVVEERRLGAEREALHTAQLNLLAHRVDALTTALSELILERESWTNKASLIGQHGVIIVVEVVVFIIVMSVCRWLGPGDRVSQMSRVALPRPTSRRHSMDDINPSVKKHRPRRPSEEAMLIAGSSHCHMALGGVQRRVSKCEVKRRKRRRKERGDGFQGGGSYEAETVLVRTNGSSENTVDPEAEVEKVVKVEAEGTLASPAPVYIKTALWSRKQRLSTSQTQTSSSQETLSTSVPTPSKPHKKPGPLKKIVKKLF